MVKGLSERTCEEYIKDLVAFTLWLRKEDKTWQTLTKQDIDQHTAEMTARGLAPRTIRKRVSVVRNYMRYEQHEGHRDDNPAMWCQSPKIHESLPRVADISQIDRYLSTEPTSSDDREVHLATAILIETGIRIGELLAIQQTDIKREEQIIRITGKGKRERIVHYSDRVRYALEHWQDGDEMLIDMSAERLRFAMYANLGKFCPRVHPHQLRHTFATKMLNNGMDIETLSCLLGHKNVTTTEIYARASSQRMAAEYNKFIF